MAVASDSYGTAAGVAALVPMHGTASTTFDASTSPTITTVEGWIDDLSDVINTILDDYGYDVPATGRLATWLKLFVQQEVAAQIRALYQRTRRGPNEDEEQERYRDLLTNIGKVNEYLDKRTQADQYAVWSQPAKRVDAYSYGFSTVDVDTDEDD